RATWDPDPPVAPTLCVPKADSTPAIDGNLDDTIWGKAIMIERMNAVGGVPARMRTTVWVMYDSQNLYLAFDCEEPELDRVRMAAQKGEDQWPVDAVEVFVDPGR